MLAAIQNGPGRDHVQPLDPADLVVMTLVRNLANIVSTSEEFAPSRDDKAEVMDRMVKEAEQAIEAGQAWLDKARPIGRIADDVVRLAGRSEERRVGEECVSTCRSRCARVL